MSATTLLALAVNDLAMRYYSNPAFRIGAFTNPDAAVRQADCNLMTLWLGQDGFDYASRRSSGRDWRPPDIAPDHRFDLELPGARRGGRTSGTVHRFC